MLNDLPNEILVKIFARLEWDSLKEIRLCCKKFTNVVKTNWKHLREPLEELEIVERPRVEGKQVHEQSAQFYICETGKYSRNRHEIFVENREKIQIFNLKVEERLNQKESFVKIGSENGNQKTFIYAEDAKKFMEIYLFLHRFDIIRKIRFEQLTIDEKMIEALIGGFMKENLKRIQVKKLTLDSCFLDGIVPEEFHQMIETISPKGLEMFQLYGNCLQRCAEFVNQSFFRLKSIRNLDHLSLNKFTRSNISYKWGNETDLFLGCHHVNGEGNELWDFNLPAHTDLLRFYNMNGVDEETFRREITRWINGERKIKFWRFRCPDQRILEDSFWKELVRKFKKLDSNGENSEEPYEYVKLENLNHEKLWGNNRNTRDFGPRFVFQDIPFY
ncbi:unnamed protein product, partial [Mesorhabditis belari]|uniref:F-box domain-containing protein n=1 Tax=Mesorhabditis belari TaxID=2138241 RepID=A0AAF3EHW0_9BILA